MRLILTTAALQLILTNGAFTTNTNHLISSQANKQQLQRLPSFTTHLNLIKNDPYESLMDRLDVPSDSAPLTTITKTAVTTTTTTTTPTPPIPPPSPVVTTTITTPPIESTTPPQPPIDTVTDTVTSSVQQAFDNLNTAAQQLTTPPPATTNKIPTLAEYLKNTAATTPHPPPLPTDPNRAPTLAEYLKTLATSFDPEQTATAVRSFEDDTAGKVKSLTDSVTSSLNGMSHVATEAATKTSAVAVQSSEGGLENIMKGLALLKDNAAHMMDTTTTPIIQTPALPTPPDFETAQRGMTIFRDNVSPLSDSLQQLGDVLQFEEYKTLYVAFGGLLFGLYQRSAGREEASETFQEELMVAQRRADEAVKASLEAASEAQKAKVLALGMEREGSGGGGGGEDLLSESRMKELEVEKSMMKEELFRVNRELSELKSQLSQVLSVQNSSPINSKPVDEATFDHTDGDDDDFISPADDMVMPRDPEEDKRIIEVLKEMDEENRMAATKPGLMQIEAEKKAAAEAAAAEMKKKKTEATKAKKKSTTTRKKKTTTTTTATTTTAKKTNTKSKSKTAKKIIVEKVMTPINGEANGHLPTEDDDESKTTKKKKTTTRKRKTKTKTTTVAKKEETKDDEEVMMTSVAEVAPPSPVPPPPIVADEHQHHSSPTTTEEDHPWAKLASSTLSRKTIKELSTFLEERGVPVTNDDGKKLAKKELVSAVQECL